MITELRTLAFAAGSALLVAACSTSTTDDAAGVTAMNLDSGEIKTFDEESDVPNGWAICSDAESCPAPHPCAEIPESPCLLREDCSPIYADGQAFSGCTVASETCEEAECGPAPGAPAFECEDGTIGGNTGRCIRSEEGVCGWEMRECPAVELCDEEDCGPALGMPAYECDDGSIGGNTGRCILYGETCGWEVRECPAGGCTSDDCGPNPYGMPNYQCENGEIGGPVCGPADGACGWSINDCAPLE